MRLYITEAGGRGRDGWPTPSDRDAVFADYEPGSPFEARVDAILRDAPPGPFTLLAHSAGAVPAAMIAEKEPGRVSCLILVEPALYDIARGDPAIERHIEAVTRARSLSAAGDLFGYWQIIGPLMFNSPAEPDYWEADEPRARRFSSRGVPWGSDLTEESLAGTRTLVITGGWNDEYEAIAEVLVRHGARHERLVGARHRPQDVEGFEALVSEFEKVDAPDAK